MSRISWRAFAALIAILAIAPAGARAAEALKEIRIDWATYNPVSLILKQKGMLEKEFAKDGIRIVWVQSAGSNKALEFLNAGSIDFGSTAGSAALVARINGNPIKSIYVFSRPEWTALVTTRDSKIATVADLKGKRVAVTRGTDPHIFLVRALLDAGLTEKDITPVLLQHADGKTALIRGDVDAWAGLDPMMAQAEIEDGAKLFFRKDPHGHERYRRVPRHLLALAIDPAMPTTATWFPERQACARTPRPIRHSVAIVQGGVATALVSVALKPF